jgi:nitric oxide synthase-interacting protein
MPSRHSKNCGDRHHFTYHEKSKSGIGSITQRLGTDSQLPFGYCPLSLNPIEDAVISPSGRIYSREAILEYLLNQTKELKIKQEAYEVQKVSI